VCCCVECVVVCCSVLLRCSVFSLRVLQCVAALQCVFVECVVVCCSVLLRCSVFSLRVL